MTIQIASIEDEVIPHPQALLQYLKTWHCSPSTTWGDLMNRI